MISEKIKSTIAEILNIAEADINDNSDLVNGLGADSLDIVQMLMRLEEDFGITFSDDEIKDIKTVGDVVKLIETK